MNGFVTHTEFLEGVIGMRNDAGPVDIHQNETNTGIGVIECVSFPELLQLQALIAAEINRRWREDEIPNAPE